MNIAELERRESNFFFLLLRTVPQKIRANKAILTRQKMQHAVTYHILLFPINAGFGCNAVKIYNYIYVYKRKFDGRLFSQTNYLRGSFKIADVFLAISFKVPERNKGKGSRITIGRMCETNKK
jgi:hypothetical protein